MRWEHATLQAPAAGELAGWWRRWPDANVGVVTGAVSGIVVLDVDPRNGGDVSLAELEATRGPLPATVRDRTGGGGEHLWFLGGAGLPSAVLAPGLELKAEGGMVIAPPSRHASGEEYRWAMDESPLDRPLASFPAWLHDLAQTRKSEAGTAPPSVRTTGEQEQFRLAWSRAGVVLRAGDRYYRCPFHDDTHPSLHVDAEGCRWYCFGCRRGGGQGSLASLLGEPSPPHPRRRHTEHRDAGSEVSLAGTYEVEVVGESRHQDALLEVAGGSRPYGGVDIDVIAELVPEPDNPHDPDALAVFIDGQVVGHVPRRALPWLGPQAAEARVREDGATCRARVRGGWDRGAGDVGFFGVTLLVSSPEH